VTLLQGLRDFEELDMFDGCCGRTPEDGDYFSDDDEDTKDCKDRQEQELEEDFCQFVTGCGPCLKSITLSVKVPIARAFEELANHCSNLMVLKIWGFDYKASTLYPALAKMSNLRVMSVTHEEVSSPQEVGTLLKGCPRLRDLSLTLASNHVPEAMDILYNYQQTFHFKRPILVSIFFVYPDEDEDEKEDGDDDDDEDDDDDDDEDKDENEEEEDTRRSSHEKREVFNGSHRVLFAF
jgi:hypothetical protein